MGSTGVNDTIHWCAAIVSTQTRCIASLKSTLALLPASRGSAPPCAALSSAGDGLAPFALVTSVVVAVGAAPLSVEDDVEWLLTPPSASVVVTEPAAPAGPDWTAPSDWLAWCP